MIEKRIPKGLPFGRLKERGYLRGKGNRNPVPLKFAFFPFFFQIKEKDNHFFNAI